MILSARQSVNCSHRPQVQRSNVELPSTYGSRWNRFLFGRTLRQVHQSLPALLQWGCAKPTLPGPTELTSRRGDRKQENASAVQDRTKSRRCTPGGFHFSKVGSPPARAARCLPRHEWRLYCATAQIIATACTARKRPGGRTTAAKGCVRQRLENAARGHSPQGIQGVLLHRPNGSTPTSASPGSSSRCEARFTPAPKL